MTTVLKKFEDFQPLMDKLNKTFIVPNRRLHITEEGNLFFIYRGDIGRTKEIVDEYFMTHFGFKPEIQVDVEEYEKWWGEDEWGQEMIQIRYYNNTTIVLPNREECVELFRSGKCFDKTKQTLTTDDDLYYCEVKSLLLAA